MIVILLTIYLSLALLGAFALCAHPNGTVTFNNREIYNPFGRVIVAWFIFAAFIPFFIIAVLFKLITWPFRLIFSRL